MYPMRPVQPPCLLAARPYDDSSRPIRGIRKVPEIAWEITLRRLSAPVRRPDDGLDGYPLPRVPPAAGAACAAVHGDGACERRDPRRSRPAAGDGSGRASGGAAAGRQRTGDAGAGGADRGGAWLRRDQPQLRLPVRPGAGRALRRLPDARAGAGGRVRGGDDRGGVDAGDAGAVHVVELESEAWREKVVKYW